MKSILTNEWREKIEFHERIMASQASNNFRIMCLGGIDEMLLSSVSFMILV